MASAYSGHVDLCQTLLNMGANVNATGRVSRVFNCLVFSSDQIAIYRMMMKGFAIECRWVGLMVVEAEGRKGA